MGYLKILLLLIFTIFFLPLRGENDIKKELIVLDKTRTFYQSLNSFTATYNYTVKQREGYTSPSYESVVTVCGEQYRYTKLGEKVYCDGEILWRFLTDLNEVTISDYTATEGDISPARMHVLYQEGFQPVGIEEKKIEEQIYDVIILEPIDEDSTICKITLAINQSTYQIDRFEIIDQEETSYMATLQKESFKPNIILPENYFTFNPSKYPDLEVIDLRGDSEDSEENAVIN